MLFSQVAAQQKTKTQLVELVQQNRLSHALLFLSKEGSGALPLALAFAQYISLLPAAKPAEPSLFGEETTVETVLPATPDDADAFMQKQPAFTKANQYIHPDIHYSYPCIPKKTGDKPKSTDFIEEWREFIQQYPYGNAYDWLQFIGAENKQGNITAEECSDIIRKLSLKSFESGHKMLVMWMIEYLGKEGNKLLKLIEEPPPDTIFIFIAENEDLILPTILSRCQLIKINSYSNADIEKLLTEKNAASAETARQIAGIAQGNYREALQALQHASEDWQALLREWLNAVLKTGPAAQLKWIEEMSRLGREKQKQFLLYFNHILQQSLYLRVTGAENVTLPAGEKDFAGRLNKIASISQQQTIVQEIDKAAYYIERNANAKMLFHTLTLKLYHIIQNKTLFLT